VKSLNEREERMALTLLLPCQGDINLIKKSPGILKSDVCGNHKTVLIFMYMLLLEGRRMRLAFFASPYELLDVKRPGQDRHFTREGTNNK